MKYLILNNKVVDKSETGFPVSQEMTWVDSNEEFDVGDNCIDGALSKQEVIAPQQDIDVLRRNAYQLESDPLFFKWQRGELEKQAWLDKVDEIRNRYA
jgi:hypothetical protein